MNNLEPTGISDYELNAYIDGMLAMEEIATMAQQARERINRQLGQHLRHTLARIELAKREHGVSK